MDHEIDIPGIIAFLARRYPRTFFVVGKNRKPIKVGIYYDLVAALKGEISEQALSLTLHYYTNEVGYLKAMKEDRPRLDLAGVVAGKVTHEEWLHSKLRLSNTLWKLKRAARGGSS